jgi:hypothetical protein
MEQEIPGYSSNHYDDSFFSLNLLEVKCSDKISQEHHKLMMLKYGCVGSQRFSCSDKNLVSIRVVHFC